MAFFVLLIAMEATLVLGDDSGNGNGNGNGKGDDDGNGKATMMAKEKVTMKMEMEMATTARKGMIKTKTKRTTRRNPTMNQQTTMN